MKTTGVLKHSLTSKYLHFHRRDVFLILDVNVHRALMKRVTGTAAGFGDYEPYYASFCVKALAFKDEIRNKYNIDLSPRELDSLLLKLNAQD